MNRKSTTSDQIIGHVVMTTDYTRFKTLEKGNRTVNEAHVRQLMNSFKSMYLVSPLLVTEKMEIVDGQHRFEAAKRLDLPVYYLQIMKGCDLPTILRAIQIYNTNTSNWKGVDYLRAYADLGYSDYIAMQKFMEDFPDFGFQSTVQILTQNAAGSKVTVSLGKHENKTISATSKSFEEGLLHIPDLEASYDIARKMLLIKPYFAHFARRIFISAMFRLFKNPRYVHEEMVAKLKLQPTSLVPCNDVTQYVELLENIYNSRRREKVNLRFYDKTN